MPGLARYSRPFITPSYGYYNCDCEPVNGYELVIIITPHIIGLEEAKNIR